MTYISHSLPALVAAPVSNYCVWLGNRANGAWPPSAFLAFQIMYTIHSTFESSCSLLCSSYLVSFISQAVYS